MQTILGTAMGRNRLRHLWESAPGEGDGWLPAGMCMFSVVLIGLAIAVALFAAWVKTSSRADPQTPAIHAPPSTERSGAKTTSRITPGDGNAAANTSTAGRARLDAGTGAKTR